MLGVRKIAERLAMLVMLVMLTACHYPQQSEEYEVGYNFLLDADSLVLQEEMPMHLLIVPEQTDSFVIYRGDALVVAQIATIPEDSIDSVWVKVARDQMTQGWVHERQLLESVVPDDPISQAIHAFSDSHILIGVALCLVALAAWLIRRMRRERFHMVHVDDIASPYPMLLCLMLSASAVLYASMQLYVPETWTYFYYHPTLNPFGLPMVLSLFLVSLWMLVVLGVATLDEVRRQLNATEAVLYMLSLVAFLALLYVVFSISTLYYVGYPLLVFYAAAAVYQYLRRHRARYQCGHCGARLHDLGPCTKCGVVNE